MKFVTQKYISFEDYFRLIISRKQKTWEVFRFNLLEKEMATHSSILAWRIPWIEEPGGVTKSQT